MSPFLRNVPLLTVSQSLMMTVQSLIVTTSALVGAAIAPDAALATLPLASQFIATMLTSIPAALLMERIGRKSGFMLATLFGMGGAVLCTLGIRQGNFWLFLGGSMLIGVFIGFGIYFRFAAADASDEAHKSRAISFIMAGGVVAAVLGPNLANWTHELMSPAFAGSYASLLVLFILCLFTLAFLALPKPTGENNEGAKTGRPLKHIARQPRFITAVICGMLGYGVMSLVMTATPLAMNHHHHDFNDTSFVIQWHVLGMFAPSFVTGHIIQRFGVLKVMFTGALMGLACVAINLSGSSVTHFWIALVLLGVSWNFLFIGATTLLTTTYRPAERAKTQAANDFIVFTTVSLAALSAGPLQHRFGWEAVNLGVIPLLVIIVASIVWVNARERANNGQGYAQGISEEEA